MSELNYSELNRRRDYLFGPRNVWKKSRVWVPVLQDPNLQLPCRLSLGLGRFEAPISKDQYQIAHSWCVQGRLLFLISSSMRVLINQEASRKVK